MFSFFSFVAFCALLLLAGLAVLFHRGRKTTALLIVAALLVALYLLFRPDCRAIEDADLTRFDPPIETRTAANFYGLKVFQQKDGNWYHCKTWIARQFFF